ncbi:MAG: lipopolysaccharide heptosyltransferase II [Nitrospirota bacterium]
MLDGSCKNLLVRGVNWIGDGVMTLPALRALRKALPGARIALLVRPWVSAVFEKDPHIDEILLYGDDQRNFIGRLKLSRLLNKRHFCGAILFQNAFDAAFITYLAGIKQRVGYSRDGRRFLLTDAVPLPSDEKQVHQINYYLNLLRQSGIEAVYSSPYIYLTLEERLRARDSLHMLNKPILGINPGATFGSAKRWFPERFAEVANWFIKDTNGSVVIFGGGQETGIADEIFRHMDADLRAPESLLSLAGNTSLRELISLISECDVFLTNDSGPLHLAYAVRTPLVAIFGSTDPALTGPPHGEGCGRSIVLKSDVVCSPCFERACKNNDMRCMYAVSSDDVYHALKQLLPGNPAVFFDRDGTLCEDAGYITRHEDLRIFQDVVELKILKKKGFRLIGVSNQSGIARGTVDEVFVREVNDLFMRQYAFDGFYYCPHHPDDHCPCRKPEPGMLLSARADHGIDLKRSFVVGDKEADMLLAKAVGAKAVLVRTGALKESEHADFTAESLTEAVNFIVRGGR